MPRIWEREITDPKPTEADHDQSKRACIDRTHVRKLAIQSHSFPFIGFRRSAADSIFLSVHSPEFRLRIRRFHPVGPASELLVRLSPLSVLGWISHERTDFYGRFMGGFGRDSCYRMHRKRTVRYMRILQSPYLQGFTLSRWFHGWGR